MKYSAWIQHHLPKEKPFLILGKGPTLERVHEDLSILDEYTVISLNHAGIPIIDKVDYVHFIDMDVPYAFKDKIKEVKKWICPWHPHMNFKPSHILPRFQVSGTKKSIFYWYNHSKVVEQHDRNKHNDPRLPIIKVHYFSAEAVFQLLYHHDIKKITTAGIDGGSGYHESMLELGLKPLTNGQDSFNRGFLQCQKICQQLNIEWMTL